MGWIKKFLGSTEFRICTFSVKGTCLSPGGRTKILQAQVHDRKKKKKKKNGVNKANIYGSKTKEEEKRENQRTDFFSRNRMNKAAMCAHTLSGFTRVWLFATPWTVDRVKRKVFMQHPSRLIEPMGTPAGHPKWKGPRQICFIHPTWEQLGSKT